MFRLSFRVTPLRLALAFAVSILLIAGMTWLYPAEAETYRIVVLSDVHLPFRPEVKDAVLQQKIVTAKNKAADDINAWGDVWRVAVLGDLAGGLGTDSERDSAVRYFSRFRKPLSFVLGNHDYIYEDVLSPFGTRVRAGADARAEKIRKFRQAFQVKELYYSQRAGQYLLVFLSTDSLTSGQLTQISEGQMEWLRQELERNPDRPTVIFFHAPLKGTVTDYKESVNTADFVAQPEKDIARLLRRHPQVFLWVSGHIHIPATQPDFASPVNVWEGTVTNIHNADMDRETIWTNSLYLLPDRVLIRTFDHAQGAWVESLDRTVRLPRRKG